MLQTKRHSHNQDALRDEHQGSAGRLQGTDLSVFGGDDSIDGIHYMDHDGAPSARGRKWGVFGAAQVAYLGKQVVGWKDARQK